MDSQRGLPPAQTDAFGFAASLEGGYPFDLGDGWRLEPQAQLVYQSINIDGFNDVAADITYSNEDSLAGRLGLRLSRSWGTGEEASMQSPQQFTLWGRADIWHEFLGEPVTELSSATGNIPFSADLGDSWARIGVGGDLQFSESTSFYGNVNYDVTFDGNAQAWEGKIGLKVQW